MDVILKAVLNYLRNKLKSKIIQYNNKIHLLVSLLKKEIKLV